jgi:hypothetical protein
MMFSAVKIDMCVLPGHLIQYLGRYVNRSSVREVS